MLTENIDLRKRARASLTGRWGEAIVLFLIYMIASSVLQGILQVIPFAGQAFSLLVVLPVGWALEVGYLEMSRGHRFDPVDMFMGFRDFPRIFCTKLLQMIYTGLWSLLFLIPGIIKAYSYAMTSYILRDEPSLEYNAAIERSMAMMEGNKMKLFMLDLSFLGWGLLSLLTCGIGFFWLTPYMYTAHAAFYDDLKKEEALKLLMAGK